MTQTTGGVAAVDRAIIVLKAVAHAGQPISLADLARQTKLYKSTILRLLVSLEGASLVTRRSNGTYELGPYNRELGRAYDITHHLSDLIEPLLHSLVQQNTESASFHVYFNESSRLCLLRVDSSHPTLDRIRPGDLLPLNRGAAGNLLSAYVVRKEQATKAGLTMVSMGERDPQCAAVASPVFDADQQVVGIISLSGPKERFSKQRITWMQRLLVDAARQATEALGGRWPEVVATV